MSGSYCDLEAPTAQIKYRGPLQGLKLSAGKFISELAATPSVGVSTSDIHLTPVSRWKNCILKKEKIRFRGQNMFSSAVKLVVCGDSSRRQPQKSLLGANEEK